MTAGARAVLMVAVAVAAGCTYWRARPVGDVGPETWAAAAPRDPLADAPAGPSVPAAAPSPADVEQALQNLDGLRRRGVIGTAEYQRRRRTILQRAFP